MSSIHTLDPQFRTPGFFTQENVNTISQLVTATIAQSYSGKKVIVPNPHIIRFMQKIHEDRLESIPKMNQRVVMELVRSFLSHVDQQERANYWAAHRWDAYNRNPEQLGIRPHDTPKLRGERVKRNDHRAFRFHYTY